MKSEIVKPKELEVQYRTANFEEVITGYSEEEMLKEANRCLQCRKPSCIEGCPVGIDIKKFIYELTQKKYLEAYKTILEKNNFPSICGRVCPAEYQCRRMCVLTKKGSNVASENSINIGLLERFVGDYGKKSEYNLERKKYKTLKNIKIAVVGSGPAGLSFAYDIARNGIRVDIFEALHQFGGVLQYGIPSFRLPRDILNSEINSLKKYNVNFFSGIVAGKTILLEELLENYSFIFIATGAGAPNWLNINGENANNIYSANEFLTRVNLMHAEKFPEYHTPINIGKKVVVIGGGNTAIDAARTAIRIQKIKNIKGEVTLFYRRTETEMPARKIEIEHAKEEGIDFQFLVQPKEFTSDIRGYVDGIIVYNCELGPVDKTGRRTSIINKNSIIKKECDMVIIAVGLKANQTFIETISNLKTNEYKDIVVDDTTMETSVKNVFAGGDVVGGEGTVIEAMSMGKKAAKEILRRINFNT